ncbi:MAG: ATP-binding protein [Nannocystaceae bacterium]
MRRSFQRLVAMSVLGSWAVGFVIILGWALGRSWTDDRARGDGVFMFHELLDQTPVPDRPARLEELRSHSSIELSLLSVSEVERRVGRGVGPGERIPHRVSFREEWYFLVLGDGESALAAGPVDPVVPEAAFPIGVLVAIIGLPAIAGLIALRVERELTKVERASEALGFGQLGVRVDTERGPSHELASRFNAMAERVERLVRDRDELVQAVSHELGSPLSRLRFQLELLGNGTEQERSDRLAAMVGELDALDDLVAELLTFVQSDDLRLELRSFDPKPGLADLVELASLEAPEDRMVDVDTVLPDGVRVLADQRLFMRAVENILRNAMRYAQGKVRLELVEEAGSVRVNVHDDGPGIPAGVREKVTRPFYRLQEDRGRRTGGVGLGLAIASRIMLRHEGSIEIGDSPVGGALVSTRWRAPGGP